ncbi:glycoside hydrolase family 88 protein [Pseudooceanicola algae]|uniref:Unsaturated glucuronyl hydrolase n=1 Tax=Pseudooceanicola algae TaxID=1537215 RepID=A0A418SHC6_9RHOB|nr:glycoside hydrolase family 88 protein [Pseudooceanicola algae]QPM90448.1 Unsaturated glucuronyl hydrolase [Pseudooceanicola algae]
MIENQKTSYFAGDDALDDPSAAVSSTQGFQDALDRCLHRVRAGLSTAGLRNPRIGLGGNRWAYCDGPDWVMGFFSGQLWLCYQLSGDATFARAAQMRRPQFREVLDNRRARDHDLGFVFSLHSVADWKLTGDPTARAMGIEAARALVARFREEGHYIQAWNPTGPEDRTRSRFANGRMIADTIQNLALLHWAHRETGVEDFREVADLHEETSRKYLVREDDTTFHCFLFDPASGEPLRGETHQGHADASCWARGQAWLIHGFANCHRLTGNPAAFDAALRLARKAEALIGPTGLAPWDYALPRDAGHPVDSSAVAVTAAGVLLLADAATGEDATRLRAFGHRLLQDLLDHCDLTRTPGAEGLLAHGAAHVPAGREDAMLPYGDYYFMEALMRARGHRDFFW